MTDRSEALDELVSRAGALYTLPAVAVEVLQLTESPQVDVQALKACIERDPALTVKILRVVNSSVFGLSREVCDLNQALALLGIKPLKLLALGFSLPESLFMSVARDQLDWYWKTALVRAVAAREISEQLFQRPGDDAFLAGLLQDIGILTLLGELRRPYAELLSEAMATHADFAQLEIEALGFEHRQLTAGLLEHWNLPPLLVTAIGTPYDVRYWALNKADHAHLVRVLHLAELFAQLIGQRRLSVLPDLLQAGEAYCQLDKPKLNELIATLEPKVRQLATVLSLPMSGGDDYSEIVKAAHERISRVAESAAGPLSRGIADEAATPLEGEIGEANALLLARQLRTSFEQFYLGGGSGESVAEVTAPAAAAEALPRTQLPASYGTRAVARAASDPLEARLTIEVGRCRSLRQPIGLAVVAFESTEPLGATQIKQLESLLDAACTVAETPVPSENLGPGMRMILLPGRDRSDAVATARRVVEELRAQLNKLGHGAKLPLIMTGAGVACAATPAKNFHALDLLKTAERCLSAALRSGGVKSLEVS